MMSCSGDNPVDTTPGPLGGVWQMTYWQDGNTTAIDSVEVLHTGTTVSCSFEYRLGHELRWQGTTTDNMNVRFDTEWIIIETGEAQSGRPLIIEAVFNSESTSFDTYGYDFFDDNNYLQGRLAFKGKRME
jgi:hypothetical protein